MDMGLFELVLRLSDSKDKVGEQLSCLSFTYGNFPAFLHPDKTTDIFLEIYVISAIKFLLFH